MADQAPLRIGTRGSPLALTQTGMVRARLIAAHPRLAGANAIETVAIKTTGDRVQNVVLAALGGKGLFTKELDEALLDGRIDVAIHSMKDVPTFLPDGIVLTTIMPREDVHDAFVSPFYNTFAELPANAVVGTASTRRRAQILARRPDLRVEPLRGNVETRIAKLNEGTLTATFLAYAGLKRLGKTDVVREIMPVETILPAVGQGALAATFRADDQRVRAILQPVVDPATDAAIFAERAMLAVLDGSCQTPIAGYASLNPAKALTLKGMIAHPDGTQIVEAEATGTVSEAEQVGIRVANELLLKAGPTLLKAIRTEGPRIYRVPSDPPTG